MQVIKTEEIPRKESGEDDDIKVDMNSIDLQPMHTEIVPRREEHDDTIPDRVEEEKGLASPAASSPKVVKTHKKKPRKQIEFTPAILLNVGEDMCKSLTFMINPVFVRRQANYIYNTGRKNFMRLNTMNIKAGKDKLDKYEREKGAESPQKDKSIGNSLVEK